MDMDIPVCGKQQVWRLSSHPAQLKDLINLFEIILQTSRLFETKKQARNPQLS